jgi:hypothetical protein
MLKCHSREESIAYKHFVFVVICIITCLSGVCSSAENWMITVSISDVATEIIH